MSRFTGRRASAPRPAAGGAALVRRKRRWPNFIIWRWAGRALGGWIPCLRRALLPHRPPARSISRNPHPGNQRLPTGLAVKPPRDLAPGAQNGQPKNPSGRQADRPDVRPGRPPAKAAEQHERAPEQPRAAQGRAPGQPSVARGRAPGQREAPRGRPLARDAGQPERRHARLAVPLGRVPEKDGSRHGAPSQTTSRRGSSSQPRPSSPARAAAQLISAIWVKA
jgi:pyruvate/2-oxoglutarate dehydrogenase complex dihydrolipoamide acyltransferase (E2) component